MRRMGALFMLVLAGHLAAAAELTPAVNERGEIGAVALDGQTLLEGVRLNLPGPRWQGTVASSGDLRVTASRKEADGSEVVEGVSPASGEEAAAITRSLRCTGGELRVAWTVVPRRALPVAAVVVQIGLPVADYRGRPWFVLDAFSPQRGELPLELPKPYSFFSEAGFQALALETPVETHYLALQPDWSGVARVQIQDDRQFGGERYSVQVYAKAPVELEAGRRYEIAITLRAVPRDQALAAWKRIEDARRALAESMECHRPATIREARPNRTELPAYERFELAVDVEGEYTNPFDPEEIALDARFTTPSGRVEEVPGFFWQGYERAEQQGVERLRPTGQFGWRVRYSPSEPGAYRYELVLRDGDRTVRGGEGTFQATPSKHPGLVRIARANPRVFEHDDGSPYFAIGENVCWPRQGATYDYDNYWAKLSARGANYARLWIGPFDAFTLERTPRGENDPFGLGRYDQAGAWRVDYVVDQAEAKGIRVLFCIDSFNSLRISPPHALWDRCPYNAAVGGPIERPEQFFTDETARKLFRNRLRYIAARWSYSPAIFAWEFWNEVNIIEKYISADTAAWHAEMARYLRAADPKRHLITTSWAGFEGDPAVDALPELDFIQSHQYGARDAATLMIEVCRQKYRDFRKPHYFGEFGTGTEAQGTNEDREGVHLHNGLWSGVVSGAAGTAMLWWWDSYVEPLDLYHHFQPVAAFTKGIPYNAVEYRPGTVAAIAYAGPAPAPRLEDWTLPNERGSWEPAPYNQPITLEVRPDGTLDPPDRLARVLHGAVNHRALHNPPTFQVDYAQPGQFVVDVADVSGHGGAKLKIYLDERLILDRDFADNSPSTENITEFNGPYAIDVPAGPHAIRVVNDGKDWMFVGYTLKGYRRRTDPGLQAWALMAEAVPAGAPSALVWMKNERYNWYNVNGGEKMRELPPTRVDLAGLPDGPYQIEWWDTYTGQITHRAEAESRAGRLSLAVPPLSRDLACKVFAARP